MKKLIKFKNRIKINEKAWNNARLIIPNVRDVVVIKLRSGEITRGYYEWLCDEIVWFTTNGKFADVISWQEDRQ